MSEVEYKSVSDIVKEFGKNENDTGSSFVQVALLTERIKNLSAHLIENKKDIHSRYGLIKMVGKRKKLLKYIKENNLKSYQDLIAKLSIRK